jgi:hypothetical protein
MTVRSHTQLHRDLRIRRHLEGNPPPKNSPGTPCLEHPYRAAKKAIRGIGPLCGPCIDDLPGDSAHRYRPGRYPCGCNSPRYGMCPFARALYQRACKAHRLAVSCPEGDPRIERLYTAWGHMMAALRRHRG